MATQVEVKTEWQQPGRVADWLNAFKADPFSTGTDNADQLLKAIGYTDLVDALEQIRDLSGSNYDSDRAWALAMQLRARVVLQGWLPNDTGV